MVSGSNSDIPRQTNSPIPGFPDLLIAVDRSGRGLREQVQQQLRVFIQLGRLPAATVLPPTRTLARELGIARSVVVDVYEQLTADGYLDARQGSGTRVAATAHTAPSVARAGDPTAPTLRLVGGLPDAALFPRTEWLRHYRHVLTTTPDHQLAYPGPSGARPLREALCDYLARVRGVVAQPDRTLVASGLTQALVMVCRALKARGAKAIAMEEPGFGLHREAIANTGLKVRPVAVDEEGLDVNRLDSMDVDAVLVAPAHSWPSGAVMSPGRRLALISWAQQHDALIIEDDYDAEFRYDRAPVGALQGLAPDQVAYTGCVSKTLTPGLRLGWIAMPHKIAAEVSRQKLFDDMGTTLLEQLTLARFIETGGMTRHLRRVRPVYRRRRDAALAALADLLPGVEVKGIAAGLHLYVQLPDWCDEITLVRTAYQRGVVVEGASWHWSEQRSTAPALVLGYGAINETSFRSGLAILASVCQDQARSRAGLMEGPDRSG